MAGSKRGRDDAAAEEEPKRRANGEAIVKDEPVEGGQPSPEAAPDEETRNGNCMLLRCSFTNLAFCIAFFCVLELLLY